MKKPTSWIFLVMIGFGLSLSGCIVEEGHGHGGGYYGHGYGNSGGYYGYEHPYWH